MSSFAPADRRSSPRRLIIFEPGRGRAVAAAAGVAAGALLLFALLLKLSSPFGRRAIADASFIVFPLTAAVGCLAAARRSSHARPWYLLGAALISWTIGSVIWAYYELVRGIYSPFPSPADAFYIAWGFPAALGIVAFLRRPASLLTSARVALDSALVGVSLLIVSWATVLHRVWDAAPASLLIRLDAIALPVIDVALASLVLVVAMRHPATTRGVYALLGAGVLLLAVTDSVYGRLVAGGAYESGSFLSLGWAAGYLLIALAATAAGPSSAAPVELPAQGTALQEAIPYVPLAAAVAVAAREEITSSDPVMLLLGAVLFGVVVAREAVIIVANRRLTSGLEAMVQGRTQELAVQKHFLDAVLDSMSDAVVAVDEEGKATVVNRAARLFLPLEVGQQLVHGVEVRSFRDGDGAAVSPETSPLARALAGEEIEDVPFTLETPGGERVVRVSARPVVDADRRIGAVVAGRDITESVRAQEQMRHQSLHDALTGLPNRMLMLDRLGVALEAREVVGAPVVVAFMDLDRFKVVNESLGHSAGDTLLKETARRLARVIGPGDTVARFGGDEFVIVWTDAERRGARWLGERIHAALREPFVIGSRRVEIGVTIGLATVGRREASAADVVREADTALAEAKRTQRGSSLLFEERLRDAAVARLDVEHALRATLARGGAGFRLEYQPEVSLETGNLVALEALLRWDDPPAPGIGPAEFVPIAESVGLIRQIGAWVLDQACRQLVAWREQSGAWPAFAVSVNVSAKDLEDPALPQEVDATLARHGVPHGAIWLEITESALMHQPEQAVEVVTELAQRGCTVCIDDFGTGQSSLSYLRRFPAKILKIDRSFVGGLGRNREDATIVMAVSQLAKSLGMKIVAEGVEQERQRRMLRSFGCEYGQGYLFSRPLRPEAVGEIAGWQAVAAARGTGAEEVV